MSHTFYCSTIECDKEVDSYEGVCDSCLAEQMSHETSECPGCGNDIYCGANGYCSNCWAERFGVEDDLSTITHKCSGEWDYSRGILVCDFEDDEDCPSHHPKKCTAKFDLVSGLWECVNENPHKCSDTWNYDYSSRENLPPPSPILTEEQELEEQIAAIEEKLKTSMTIDQKADWEFLWHKAKSRQRELSCQGCLDKSEERDDHRWHKGGCDSEEFDEINWAYVKCEAQRNDRIRNLREECQGCRDDCLNQQGHMGPGGCLDEPDWADY